MATHILKDASAFFVISSNLFVKHPIISGMLYSIILDGHQFYFDTNLYPELYQILTSPDFHSENPEEKALAIQVLQQLQTSYFVMDGSNLKGRLPQDVQAQLPKTNPLQIYGVSSFSLQPEEDTYTNNHDLDQIYGANLQEYPQIVAGHASPTLNGTAQGTHFVMLNFPEQGKTADKYHLEYVWHSGYKDKESVDGALSFIDHFKEQIRDAAEIVATGNPDLDARLIELNLMSLVFLESKFYDDTDIKQDLAVLARSTSPWAQKFNDQFTGLTSPLNWLLTTSLGYTAYTAASNEMIEIDNQGFGPLQIIPNLIKAAWQNDELRERYKSHLPANFDPNNEDQLFSALFDPQFMFVLKAMTYDLECQNMRKLGSIAVPFINPPFLASEADAKSLVITQGAFHLVQMPEDVDFVYEIYNQNNSASVSFNFAEYVTNLGIMALLMTDDHKTGFSQLQIHNAEDRLDKGVVIASIQSQKQTYFLWSAVWFDQQ